MVFIIGTIVWLFLIFVAYKHSDLKEIKRCYAMLLTKQYWTNYNIVEFVSWVSKAIIIVPGLIFGVQIWWLYFITLITSLSLIWASNKKMLPTLIGFNTIWVWISCIMIVKNIITS